MWAHGKTFLIHCFYKTVFSKKLFPFYSVDLEKRQHAVAAGELSLVEPVAGRGADDGVAMAGGWGGVEKVE